MSNHDKFLSVVNSIRYLTLNDHIRLLEAYKAKEDKNEHPADYSFSIEQEQAINEFL